MSDKRSVSEILASAFGEIIDEHGIVLSSVNFVVDDDYHKEHGFHILKSIDLNNASLIEVFDND